MKFHISLYNGTLHCPFSKYDQKYLEFDIWVFPGISGSGFFPEKKRGGGQILAHFIAHMKVSYFIHKLKLWQDVADAKSLEN